ncbi:MAG TPA: hypothetical protein VJH24_00505 [Candidatus Bilamarchaeaceae archaeon]|nr:hypothetical protein [Candidatus Bilamarchaeaceae archaeon]
MNLASRSNGRGRMVAAPSPRSFTCVAVKAESEDIRRQIEEELEGLGGIHRESGLPPQSYPRLIAAGYLGYQLERAGLPVSCAVRNQVWEGAIEIISPLDTFAYGPEKTIRWWLDDIAAGTEVFPALLAGAPLDQLISVLKGVTSLWAPPHNFNPAGVRTDLEFALEYLQQGK